MSHRFFLEPQNISDGKATITGPEARHLASVLRLRPGDPVVLLDGAGTIHQARLLEISPGRATAEILDSRHDPPAYPRLFLGLGILKGAKMELAIQKATELGVTGFLPFLSGNCSVPPPSPEKKERWRRIAFEACKQSGQSRLPLWRPVTDLGTLLEHSSDYDLKIIFWEDCNTGNLKAILSAADIPASALILIGPEGGFKTDEIAEARRAGFEPATLGKRILRAETAAVAALSILQYLFGNLS